MARKLLKFINQSIHLEGSEQKDHYESEFGNQLILVHIVESPKYNVWNVNNQNCRCSSYVNLSKQNYINVTPFKIQKF